MTSFATYSPGRGFDDYLIALARATHADYVVSGDRHLLDLDETVPPVLTPRQFLDLLGA